MSLFALGTFVAIISPNFSLLLMARVFQAAGAGIMMPLLQTIMFLLFPIERRGTAMGMFGLVIAFVPAIGTSFTGWLVDLYYFKFVFIVVFLIVDFIFIV